MEFINTNALWDEMSGIANEALSGIDNVLEESKAEIKTAFGVIHYDNDEQETYIRNKYGDEEPLRELNTHDILNIADEVNEWITKNQ